MLSEFQQKQLWETWLGSEMRANYFAELCGQFQRRHSQFTWAILLCSSGAAISFLSGSFLPHWCKVVLPPVLSLAVAAISLYSIVQQNLRKVSECSDLHFRWHSLAIQSEELWNNVHADDASAKLHVLLEKGAEISKSALTLPYDQEMMLKWEEHVLKDRIPNYVSPATA